MTTADTDRIKSEIEATRADVARTVVELTARLDVKARVRAKRQEIKANVEQAAAEAQANALTLWHEQPRVVIGAGAAAAALLTVMLVRKVRG